MSNQSQRILTTAACVCCDRIYTVHSRSISKRGELTYVCEECENQWTT